MDRLREHENAGSGLLVSLSCVHRADFVDLSSNLVVRRCKAVERVREPRKITPRGVRVGRVVRSITQKINRACSYTLEKAHTEESEPSDPHECNLCDGICRLGVAQHLFTF